MQALETLGRSSVELGESLLDGVQYLAFGGALGEGVLEPGSLGIGIVMIGEGAEAVGQGFERSVVAEDRRIIPWADREVVFIVLDMKRPVRTSKCRVRVPLCNASP